jgi:hypothetical protein
MDWVQSAEFLGQLFDGPSKLSPGKFEQLIQRRPSARLAIQ